MDAPNSIEDIGRTVSESDLGSCQGCRRRKLKCSREQPVCSHCQRLGSPCVYDGKKNKPGLKPGAVEGLSRRIDALENALLEKQRGDGDRLENSLSILSNLSVELCKIINKSAPPASMMTPQQPPAHAHSLSPASTASWQRHESNHAVDPSTMQRAKRRRVDSCGNPRIEIQVPLEDLSDPSSTLPPPELLEDIVCSYFDNIQPWIPILHETRFRARINDSEQRPSLVVILHAIVVAALRFIQPEAHGLVSHNLEALAKKSRSVVILTAMDGLSVENLQALIIIAFDDIGHGTAKAWSIIGSLTRTVEYLQLSVETEDHDTQPLLKPLLSLMPPEHWVEEEERRRVFWCIFNLDRFCSVTTGWNTSLTADDVHRRLPADGGLWHKEEAVMTPYFGIWDRSAAKIGNSIAFLHANYSSPDHSAQSTMQQGSPQSTSHAPRNGTQPDMSAVGAFAYCIEATESLSRVTTFFLQQRINFHDRQEVSNWLTRFKELDLRLVHWKMFLPQKWKDSNISRQPTVINMDPNLTLAHATHNTSMILLHQRIAYPPADWTNIVELPSLCSAEICRNAATEIQDITAKYLKNTPDMSPVGNQFAFCVFVAARVLLVHKRYYGAGLPQELWLLIDSLDAMAKRWLGSIQPVTDRTRSLAGIYADHLRDLHCRCVADPNFSVDVLGYSTIVSSQNTVPTRGGFTQHHGTSQRTQPQQRNEPDEQGGWYALRQQQHQRLDSFTQGGSEARASSTILAQNFNMTESPNRLEEDNSTRNLNNNENPTSAQPNSGAAQTAEDIPPDTLTPMGYGTSQGAPNDELSAISYTLLDRSFMDMDRVISFDDMLFSMNLAPSGGPILPTSLP
ncbi:fungal-specific transcription factor domain-containing protein [Thelonectria olida]|uniref:Fungal-specific transcription factor domain-containing protein n=1 Tax=Thelonectria olida TaxID=1576542 RepID=A0A9P9AQQ3_9HYPO|nr:fungal-specific transcription factor domain-containing protein [Thelonectria olida]